MTTPQSRSELLPPSEYTGELLCLCCGAGFETGNRYAICADGEPGSRFSHAESCATYTWREDRLCDACEAMIGPDCREGKHRACDGGAWDDFRDIPTACQCGCHEEAQ